MNKQISKISLPSILVIAFCIVALLARTSYPKVNMTVYATGTPDSYGSRIYALAFYQNGTGTWTVTGQTTYSLYTSGQVLTINANQHTVITVGVQLNITLAPDVATASTYARIYITISGVVTSALCTYYSGGFGGGYYTLYYWWPSTPASYSSTWIPSAGINYTVTLAYQAYY